MVLCLAWTSEYYKADAGPLLEAKSPWPQNTSSTMKLWLQVLTEISHQDPTLNSLYEIVRSPGLNLYGWARNLSVVDHAINHRLVTHFCPVSCSNNGVWLVCPHRTARGLHSMIMSGWLHRERQLTCSIVNLLLRGTKNEEHGTGKL